MYPTRHAQIRSQQRGIDLSQALDLLKECGAKTYNKDGSVTRFFDKRARIKIEDYIGSEEAKTFLDKNTNLYCVHTIDGARVVTIGHRYRRIQQKRHLKRRRK